MRKLNDIAFEQLKAAPHGFFVSRNTLLGQEYKSFTYGYSSASLKMTRAINTDFKKAVDFFNLKDFFIKAKIKEDKNNVESDLESFSLLQEELPKEVIAPIGRIIEGYNFTFEPSYFKNRIKGFESQEKLITSSDIEKIILDNISFKQKYREFSLNDKEINQYSKLFTSIEELYKITCEEKKFIENEIKFDIAKFNQYLKKKTINENTAPFNTSNLSLNEGDFYSKNYSILDKKFSGYLDKSRNLSGKKINKSGDLGSISIKELKDDLGKSLENHFTEPEVNDLIEEINLFINLEEGKYFTKNFTKFRNKQLLNKAIPNKNIDEMLQVIMARAYNKSLLEIKTGSWSSEQSLSVNTKTKKQIELNNPLFNDKFTEFNKALDEFANSSNLLKKSTLALPITLYYNNQNVSNEETYAIKKILLAERGIQTSLISNFFRECAFNIIRENFKEESKVTYQEEGLYTTNLSSPTPYTPSFKKTIAFEGIKTMHAPAGQGKSIFAQIVSQEETFRKVFKKVPWATEFSCDPEKDYKFVILQNTG